MIKKAFKTLLKNVYKAPKSTLIGLMILVPAFIFLLSGMLSNESFSLMITPVIPFIFQDLLKERKNNDLDNTGLNL